MSDSMTRRNALEILAGTALTATVFQPDAAAYQASAQGHPTETSWASFRYGPQQRGIAHTQLAANPTLKWEKQSVDGWVATCAIVADHVYAPALQGYLYCLDRQTGEELWKYRSIESTDEKQFAPGFKAAPLVIADAVYIGDEDGVLHAINRASGKPMWRFATGSEIAGGVALFENKLLLASHDFYLYCLSQEGKEQWKFETNDMINCSPGIAEHFTFLSGCDALLRVVDIKSGEEIRSVEMESHLIASPAIVDDMLYIGSHAGDVSAVNWKTGDLIWRYNGDRDLPYHASAAVTDDLVLVGSHDKNMHAIDRATGKARWVVPTKARIESSAAVVDSRVFFGSGDGNLYGLNVQDGKEIWKFNGGKSISAGVAIGEGCLVVGEDDHNGHLRCFA